MGQIRRPGLTSAQKTELWDRWQRGESLKAIGRAFGKPSSSIYCLVSPHGGIRPLERRRSKLALTLWEREEISRGIVAQLSIRSIASIVGRAPSTVSRDSTWRGKLPASQVTTVLRAPTARRGFSASPAESATSAE